MRIKKGFLPLRTHLVKYARREMEWKDGCLVLTNKRLLRPATLNTAQCQDYFKRVSKQPGFEMVPVLTVDSRLYKLYVLVNWIDDSFSEKMLNYVEIRVLPPILQDIRPTIREFLALYEIYESDYSQNTAYKKWQRSKQYENYKRYQKTLKTRSNE